jgi:hypothetical protein
LLVTCEHVSTQAFNAAVPPNSCVRSGNWTFSQSDESDIQSLVSFDFSATVALEHASDHNSIDEPELRDELVRVRDHETNLSLPTEISTTCPCQHRRSWPR